MANISIGTTEFYIDVSGSRKLSRDELKRYSEPFFKNWADNVDNTLNLKDYFLSLYVEEGSLKVTKNIMVTLATLYAGISQYDSFVSGLETLSDQFHTVNNKWVQNAYENLPSTYNNCKFYIRMGTQGDKLAELQELCVKVSCRAIGVEEAMPIAEDFLGPEFETDPNFKDYLQKSLTKVYEENEELSFNEGYGDFLITKSGKFSIPMPTSGPKCWVEVWRESREAEVKVKVKPRIPTP